MEQNKNEKQDTLLDQIRDVRKFVEKYYQDPKSVSDEEAKKLDDRINKKIRQLNQK